MNKSFLNIPILKLKEPTPPETNNNELHPVCLFNNFVRYLNICNRNRNKKCKKAITKNLHLRVKKRF